MGGTPRLYTREEGEDQEEGSGHTLPKHSQEKNVMVKSV